MLTARTMNKERTPENRNVSISDFDIWRANQDNLVEEIRQDISKRVGANYLPKSLSEETRISIINLLSQSNKNLIKQLNHIRQRYWIAELCDFEYTGDKGRCYTFNKVELQKIEYILENEKIDKEGEIKSKNPPRCKRMRIE